MTDKAIIKALEYCSTGEPCFFCFYQKQCEETDLSYHALDLINRQQAEIERLQNERFCIANERDAIADCLDTAVEEAKAEAIKEFAERLKPMYKVLCVDEGDWYNEIDNLVKEMVGDAE